MAENTQKQAQDLLLILDKEKMLLQALAKTDPNGKTKTVPPTPEHNNDFLRFNSSDDWLDSFATNFWNQAKDEDSGPSCSLAEALEKQDLFINSTLAQLGCNLLWKMFRHGMLEHRGLYLNLETLTVNPIRV